jgi:hypothetical membrane protein
LGTDRARLIRLSFGLAAVVGAVGMAIAMAMATSFWWWDQSASALGTDLAGGFYFNVTMVLLGIAFIPAAAVSFGVLRESAAAGLLDPRWAMAARLGVSLIPLALALVGLFRIDEGVRANRIHNVAGFTVPLVVMAMMLTVGWGTRGSLPHARSRSLLILAAIVAMFVLSVLEIISYALMEMISFAICWWWLLVLVSTLDRRLAEPSAPTLATG